MVYNDILRHEAWWLLFCPSRWFHGKIKREKSEELLDVKEDGLFLVRESVNYPGDFTLSVCHRNKVEHYRIMYKENKMTIDEESYFDNLAQLVEVLFPCVNFVITGIC